MSLSNLFTCYYIRLWTSISFFQAILFIRDILLVLFTSLYNLLSHLLHYLDYGNLN